ncbi:MAG TPA: methyltransferase domain-containing protein [Chloroflexia bacterium]|nr:methyltransferase domain-containing protein [Chloroflexia bacterium]
MTDYLPSDLETSLAPREGRLLTIPFDQYGRLRIAQHLTEILHTEISAQSPGNPQRLRILDVGGYPGNLRDFVDHERYDLTILDVVPDDGSIPGYIQGTGLGLPFADGSFDVVTSLDVLEHIPDPNRAAFLNEIMRVSRHAALLINPIQSLQADLAEETLDEYIRWIMDAQQEQLAEHREFGLPDFERTSAQFAQAGWQTQTFRLANVYNWLLMMVAKHYLISLGDEKASAFEHALDRFYNLTFFEADRSEPNYRGALVAVRPGLEEVIRQVQAAYPPLPDSESSNGVRLGLTQTLMSLLNLKSGNHEDFRLREQMERRDRHIAGLESRIATQDTQAEALRSQISELQAHVINIQSSYEAEFTNQKAYMARLESDVKAKDEHILYLEKLLQGLQSGRVFRATRSVSRFLRK